MRRVQSLGIAVRDWYLAPAPMDSLVVLRVVLGLVGVMWFSVGWHRAEFMFGGDGLLRWVQNPKAPLFVQTHIQWIYGIGLLSSILLTLGVGVSLVGTLLVVAHGALLSQTQFYTWGWASTYPIFLIYVVMAGRAVGRGAQTSVGSAWPLRLLQLHVGAVYLAAGWHRIHDGAWLRGEVTFEALNTAVFTRFPYTDFGEWRGLLELSCYFAWAVELAAPLFLWWRVTRKYVALGLIGMHVGLELTATVGYWQIMMVGALFAFLPERWVAGTASLMQRLSRRLTFSRSPTADDSTAEPMLAQRAP